MTRFTTTALAALWVSFSALGCIAPGSAGAPSNAGTTAARQNRYAECQEGRACPASIARVAGAMGEYVGREAAKRMQPMPQPESPRTP